MVSRIKYRLTASCPVLSTASYMISFQFSPVRTWKIEMMEEKMSSKLYRMTSACPTSARQVTLACSQGSASQDEVPSPQNRSHLAAPLYRLFSTSIKLPVVAKRSESRHGT